MVIVDSRKHSDFESQIASIHFEGADVGCGREGGAGEGVHDGGGGADFLHGDSEDDWWTVHDRGIGPTQLANRRLIWLRRIRRTSEPSSSSHIVAQALIILICIMFGLLFHRLDERSFLHESSAFTLPMPRACQKCS